MSPELGIPLRAASQLTVTIGRKTYVFGFKPPGVAIDEASHCAGMPTMQESLANQPKNIVGAGDWQLLDNMPGTDKCSVRLSGNEVDTMLSINKEGKLILIAGNNQWVAHNPKVPTILQIDDAPPLNIETWQLGNIVLFLVSDDAVAERLKRAVSIKWHFPWGDFHANVTGLGVAAEALKKCNSAKIAH